MSFQGASGPSGPAMAVTVALLCLSGAAAAQSVSTAPSVRWVNAPQAAPSVPVGQAATATVNRTVVTQDGRRARKDPRTGEFIDGPVEQAGVAPAPGEAPLPGISGEFRPEEVNEMMLRFMQQRQAVAIDVPAGAAMALGEEGMSSSVVVRQADGRLAAQCVPGESAAAHRAHARPAVNLKALKETAHAVK